MDTELLKTFLEVNRTRHFRRAADNLFLTPSAVSARVRQLEGLLGVPLFSRGRNDIHLTPAGERLVAHAQLLLSAWERARQDVSLGAEQSAQLTLAAAPSLWDAVLEPWLARVYRQNPQLGMRVLALPGDAVAQLLRRNQLDLAISCAPVLVESLSLREVGSLELILVASAPGVDAAKAIAENYLRVDWGTAFESFHAARFPGTPPARTQVGGARLAYSLLQEAGGAAYLAEPMVRRALTAGRLHRVEGAPSFRLQLYAAWPVDTDKAALIDQLLESL